MEPAGVLVKLVEFGEILVELDGILVELAGVLV